MTRIFLIGYMGVGKTTAGRALASRMNLEFIDLDLFIQNRYNCSINKIFENEGEARFREIEHRVLQEVSTFEDVVVSTGGGVPCFFNNMEIMNEAGITVYLKAEPRLLAERLKLCKDKRPLLKDKSESELLDYVTDNLDKRDPFYSRAQIVFENGQLVNKYDMDAYMAELIERIKNR